MVLDWVSETNNGIDSVEKIIEMVDLPKTEQQDKKKIKKRRRSRRRNKERKNVCVLCSLVH